LRSVILELIFCQFYFDLCSKLRTIILKLWTAIIDDWSANLYFENGYSLELRYVYTPSSQTSLDPSENISLALRRGGTWRKRRIWMRNEESDRKSTQFLVYSFSLFCSSHVELYFCHGTVCSWYSDVWLDTLLGV
jgi:hypothetical protein